MDSIIGTWHLRSFEMNNGTQTIKPFGDHIQGLLIYQENGYMSGIISGENRPNVSSLSVLGISEEERLAISKNFISYAGRYTVSDNSIIHSVYVSYIPNLMYGEPHEVLYEISDGMLITSSKPQHDGQTSFVVSLTWDRVRQPSTFPSLLLHMIGI